MKEELDKSAYSPSPPHLSVFRGCFPFRLTSVVLAEAPQPRTILQTNMVVVEKTLLLF